MERGYEDAYRQFIEPVVGASGERVGQCIGSEFSPERSSRIRSQRSQIQSASTIRSQAADEKPATELIHAGEVDRGRRRAADHADLRDDARSCSIRRADVAALPRGQVVEAISTRATRTRRWSRSSRSWPRSTAPRRRCCSVRHGGDHDRADAPAQGRRRGGLLRGDLRRHVSPPRGPARALRHHAAVRVARGARDAGAVYRTEHRLVWFESPINPTLRCVDVRAVAAACRAPACSRSSTTRSPARSTSRRSRWASTWRCRAPRSTSTATATSPAACCPDGARSCADREDAAAARRRHGSAAGVCARPRPEDAAAARGAAQRQRAGGGASSSRASRRRARLLSGPASHPDHAIARGR